MRRRTTKLELRKKVSIIAMPGASLLLLFWGLQRGYPLWTCFLAFSRMCSKGSRSTLGVWGLRVCSLDVAFVVATVRNRPQPFARLLYGRAYGKVCRGGPFW